jgi:parvulin-like peptidyl-prolyl isomerase
MARIHCLFIALVAICLAAGCESLQKWRDKQTRIARGEYEEPAGPVQHGTATQPLFRQREFNAVEEDQDGPLIRADVMLVNGQTVKASDVLEPIWKRLEQMAAAAKPSEYPEKAQLEIRQRVRETISEFLVYYEVKRKINSDTQEQLKKTVDGRIWDRINKDFEGSQAKFERYLSARGLTLEDYKEQETRRIVTVQYLREEILPQIHISRRQLREFYEENRKDFESPARVKLQMIDLPEKAFLAGPTTDPVARMDAHEAAAKQARRAMSELRAGADFGEVAKKYSKGLHAEEGGRWDWVSQDPGLQGRWAAPCKAAFALAAGQCSDILEVSDGYFIVRAEEKVEAQRKSFEEVQQELEEKLRSMQFDLLSARYLSKLWVKGDIQGLMAFNARLLTLAPQARPKAESAPPAIAVSLGTADEPSAAPQPVMTTQPNE